VSTCGVKWMSFVINLLYELENLVHLWKLGFLHL
jgi:hypothetical protein